MEAFARGKGVGQVMLDVADAEAVRRNCGKVYLWAYEGNRAKHLYMRNGYEVTESKGGCCMKCILGMSPFLKMEKPLLQN